MARTLVARATASANASKPAWSTLPSTLTTAPLPAKPASNTAVVLTRVRAARLARSCSWALAFSSAWRYSSRLTTPPSTRMTSTTPSVSQRPNTPGRPQWSVGARLRRRAAPIRAFCRISPHRGPRPPCTPSRRPFADTALSERYTPDTRRHSTSAASIRDRGQLDGDPGHVRLAGQRLEAARPDGEQRVRVDARVALGDAHPRRAGVAPAVHQGHHAGEQIVVAAHHHVDRAPLVGQRGLVTVGHAVCRSVVWVDPERVERAPRALHPLQVGDPRVVHPLVPLGDHLQLPRWLGQERHEDRRAAFDRLGERGWAAVDPAVGGLDLLVEEPSGERRIEHLHLVGQRGEVDAAAGEHVPPLGPRIRRLVVEQ